MSNTIYGANANTPVTSTQNANGVGLDVNLAPGSIALISDIAEVTRGTSVVAYAAHGIVSSLAGVVLDWDMARVAGGAGRILSGLIRYNDINAVFRGRLHLYTVAPAAIADQSPMTILYSSTTKKVGFIDFPALGTGGAGSDAAEAQWSGFLPFACEAGDTKVYGLVETLDVFTPVASKKLLIKLTGEAY